MDKVASYIHTTLKNNKTTKKNYIISTMQVKHLMVYYETHLNNSNPVWLFVCSFFNIYLSYPVLYIWGETVEMVVTQ